MEISVLGIDISEKMLAYARKNNAASNIEYRRLAFEELDDLDVYKRQEPAGALSGFYAKATPHNSRLAA